MLVINHVHKLQGLDKSLPVCLELKQRLGAEVLCLVELEPGSRQEDVEAFQGLIEACCDQWLVMEGPSRRRRRCRWARLLERWQRRGLPGTVWLDQVRRWRQSRPLREMLQRLDSAEQPILLTIYNGVDTPIGGMLARLTGRRGGVRLGYLKSLHDQGLGLSDLQQRSSNLTRRLTLQPCLDGLLTPELAAFRQMLERKGVANGQMVKAGYPPAYASWRSLVRQVASTPRQRGLKIVLFSRGEVPHKPDSEQIIQDRWLLRAIRNLQQELCRRCSEHELWIKPHPYQRRDGLEALCANDPTMHLVETPPCMLVANADLAIATYSSAILDAVAAGVPELNTSNQRRPSKGSIPTDLHLQPLVCDRSETRNSCQTP
jgi:hypothetical protein